MGENPTPLTKQGQTLAMSRFLSYVEPMIVNENLISFTKADQDLVHEVYVFII